MDAVMMGIQICRLRKSKGMTQKQLAQKLGVTDKAVSKWERGINYPDIELLKPLAEILEISVAALLCGTDQETGSAADIAAEISAQGQRQLKRTVLWRMALTAVLGLALFMAAISESYMLNERNIFGWPQGMLGGIMGIAGVIIGNSLYLMGLMRRKLSGGKRK